MPELPEVETVRLGLNSYLPGKEVSMVTFDWPKSFPNAQSDVDRFLVGSTILEIKRRAKVLIIELSSKYSLVIHLKMTGQLVYVQKARHPEGSSSKSPIRPSGQNQSVQKSLEPDEPEEVRFGAGHPNDSLVGSLPDKSTRVTLTFTDSSKLFFNDQRKFGWMRLLPTAEVPNIDFFQKVGPEPLSADFAAKDFRGRLARRKNSTIKAALLDQTVIAGVGNIYADESLWAAKIHPSERVINISQSKLNTLFKELKAVLALSIEKGGSSDRNYVNAEGKKGSYLDFANVFRREGLPCTRHPGTSIIKLRVAGRGTHICPMCQRLSG